jgi:hypothetical protein
MLKNICNKPNTKIVRKNQRRSSTQSKYDYYAQEFIRFTIMNKKIHLLFSQSIKQIPDHSTYQTKLNDFTRGNRKSIKGK